MRSLKNLHVACIELASEEEGYGDINAAAMVKKSPNLFVSIVRIQVPDKYFKMKIYSYIIFLMVDLILLKISMIE